MYIYLQRPIKKRTYQDHSTLSFWSWLNMSLLKLVVVCGIVGKVGCRCGLCESRGWPCLGDNWFQLTPMDAPQGTVEPCSQDGGTSVRTCLGKGKNAQWVERSEGKEKKTKTKPTIKWDSTVQTLRWEKKEGEAVRQVPDQALSCSLWRGPWCSRYLCFIPRWAHAGVDLSWRIASQQKNPFWSKGKGWEGRSSREELLDTPLPTTAALLALQG